MKLFKRETYEGDRTFWQIGTTDYFLSEDKTELYLFVPYTAEDNEFDVELKEKDNNGSTWRIHKLDLSIIREDFDIRKDILIELKRHLKGIEKAVEKLEKE